MVLTESVRTGLQYCHVLRLSTQKEIPHPIDQGSMGWESEVVGTGGFEPPTLAVSGRCSPTELHACDGAELSLAVRDVNSFWGNHVAFVACLGFNRLD